MAEVLAAVASLAQQGGADGLPANIPNVPGGGGGLLVDAAKAKEGLDGLSKCCILL
jgi:hypothetical protein